MQYGEVLRLSKEIVLKVLITGGAGFIGSNLALRIQRLRPTWNVIILDNFSTGKPENLSGFSGKVIEGDILDLDSTKDTLFNETEAVVHLAALGSVPRSLNDPMKTFSNNTLGTQILLEKMRLANCKRIVFSSSSSVYGQNPSFPKKETDYLAPLSPYAASKSAGESLIMSYANSFEFKATIFRFFNVYGPRQNPEGPYAAVIPKFIQSALTGKAIEINGDGKQTRDFTFIDNVTDSIIESIDNELQPSTPVNLALGSQVSILEIVKTLESILGRTIPHRFLPERKGDVKSSKADTKVFETYFTAQKKIDFEQGLKATIDWFSLAENQVGVGS
jgi:UDP-glucose 4-epimerase